MDRSMQIDTINSDTRAVDAPAKINLSLEVLGRRPDGYHEICSVMQAISLADRVTVRRTDGEEATLTVRGNDRLAVESDNLVLAAWRLMKERFSLSGGVMAELEKNIPVGAGLGGGSSDCAAMLLLVNDLYGLGLARRDLAELGATLGSDVPFFFSSGQAVVKGRGEQVTDIDLPFDYHLLLICPSIHISTAKAYSQLRMPLTVRQPTCTFIDCQTVDELVGSLRHIGNDFERSLLDELPELAAIKSGLDASQALWTSMSGSGPTMFGIFGEDKHRTDIAGDFNRGGWLVVTAQPIALFQR